MTYQVNTDLVEALARAFIQRTGENFITGALKPTTGSTVSLGDVTHVFSELYVGTVHAANIQVAGTPTSDSVDGFHASAAPKPNTLLPLNGSGVFPSSVYDQALLRTGGTLTGNLAVAAGVTVDGVDLNVLDANFASHKQQSVVQAHGSVGQHDHMTAQNGGDLVQYPSTEGYGTRAGYAANRLNRAVLAGAGLLGGGTLDKDITLYVRTGSGLQIDPATAAVALAMPGTVGYASGNTASGNHTHQVDASYDAVDARLLRSNASGALRLFGLALGSQAIPTVSGGLSASGDVRGNRIISDQDAFVGSDLSVSTNVLATAKIRSAVYINRETAQPAVFGALTVRPGSATQRGLVVQGKTGQEMAAPLFSAVDASGQDLFMVRGDGSLESGDPGFVSGTQGWKITHEGDAEFRNITARGELHTSIFSANELHATGGSMAVMQTGVVASPIAAADNLMNDIDGVTTGTQFKLVISGVSGQGLAGLATNGSPSNPGFCPFKADDVLRMRLITGTKE